MEKGIAQVYLRNKNVCQKNDRNRRFQRTLFQFQRKVLLSSFHYHYSQTHLMILATDLKLEPP